EQDDVGQFGFGDVECARAVIGGYDLEILTRELGFEQLDVQLDVINDQHTGGHGSGKPGSGKKALDGAHEAGNGDRLGDVRLAAAVADLLFIALHRKSGHRDDRDRPQIIVFLEPFGNLEPGHLGQLNVHQDQIRPV